MARKVAEEMRTIRLVAENEADVPDALRLIAEELEGNGGSLRGISIAGHEVDGTDGERRNVVFEAQILSYIER